MKTSAAEYFSSMSPVKDDGSSHNTGHTTGRGGRCHCCPYGYHIDLDFVRYCHTLAKGSEQESATLRKLKQSKRQRRRETHSMEMMLGLTHPLTNGRQEAPVPPPRNNSLKHLRNHLNGEWRGVNGAPPPDVIASNDTPRSKQHEFAFTEASTAFQEAMHDFEVTLSSSHECEGDFDPLARRTSFPRAAPASVDLLQHAPPNTGSGMGTAMASILAQSAVNRVRSNSVTRSNSLPRYFPDDSSHLAWFSKVRPSAQPTPPQGGGLSLREALASLEAARGRVPPPLLDDVMSVTSAASQLSTSTLQREVETLRAERQQHRLQRDGEGRTRDLLSGRTRRRSQSPVRVNLEEFCSYRRARAGSDCSDTESVASDTRGDAPHHSLYISETHDSRHRQPPNERRVVQRDATTMCRVVTRDVGVHHAARTRSVGVMADLLPPSPPAARERSPPKDVRRPSLRGVLSSVSRGTQTTDDKLDAKTRLFGSLGRQNSAIINRLAEVQKEAPALTFDNSTNTDAKYLKNQSSNTDSIRTKEQKCNTLLSSSEVLSRDEFNVEVGKQVKSRIQDQITRAKNNWDAGFEDMLQTRLKEEVEKIEENYSQQFEQEVEKQVRTELSRARSSIEQDINDEVDSRVADEMVEAKERWLTDQQHVKETCAPVTRDRAAQTSPLPKVEVVKPSMRSIAVGEGTLKPAVRSIAVGEGTLKPAVRSIAVGEGTLKPSVRTMAVGEGTLTDVLCDKCSAPKRSIGCSWDKVTDVVCDTCEHRKRSLASKPITKSTFVQTIPPVVEKVSSKFSQTSAVSSKSASTNTTFLALRKEDAIVSSCSPVITPELERRPFGSSGVNICDKCHDTITSVAKDIVGTTGSVTMSSDLPVIVPLPASSGNSKIPRLVDPMKLEPRLDPVCSDLRIGDGAKAESSVGITTKHVSDTIQSTGVPNQTPDILSDTRRGSNSARQTVPFTRQQTYTKLEDEHARGSAIPDSPKQSRKMSSFAEEDELLAASGDSRKHSSCSILTTKAKVNVYRREKSSPEIAVTQNWKRQKSPSKDDHSLENSQNETDSWQREMTSFVGQSDRMSRSGSVDSNATYKVDDSTKSPSPGNRGPVSCSPPRKATPIPRPAALPASLLPSSTAASDTSRANTPFPPRASHNDAAVTTLPDNQSPPSSIQQTADAAAQEDQDTHDIHQSITSLDDNELLDSGDESLVASSIATSTFTASGDKGVRKKAKMGRNLRAALKVLNDSIGKPVRSGQQLTNALNIIQRDWFKVSSQIEANPHHVEDYLDAFEMQYSRGLLHRVVNLADVNGNTAMHYAVSHGNYDVVSLLLDSKVCSVNQQNKAGYTATMLVSLAPIKCSTHASVVERLFSMSDVNVKADQHGQTALMLAVSHGRLDTVRLLLTAGADVNIQDDDGSSAVMCAAEHGHLAIVRLLLQCADTDAHLVDNDGSSALAIAVEAGHKDVGVLLYKHMNLGRTCSPYSSLRGKQRSRTPTLPRSSLHTPPPRFSAPPSPGRSRRGSGPPSPPSSAHNSPHTQHRRKQASASLSNLNF